MRFASLLTAFSFVAAAAAQSNAVTAWLATEVPVSKAGLLANIGGTGSKATGVPVRIIDHDDHSCQAELTLLSLGWLSSCQSQQVEP
jgi:hypothetical protein